MVIQNRHLKTTDYTHITEKPTPVVMSIQEFANLPYFKDYLVKDIGYDWNQQFYGYTSTTRFWLYKNQEDLQNDVIAGWIDTNGNPASNVVLAKEKVRRKN